MQRHCFGAIPTREQETITNNLYYAKHHITSVHRNNHGQESVRISRLHSTDTKPRQNQSDNYPYMRRDCGTRGIT